MIYQFLIQKVKGMKLKILSLKLEDNINDIEVDDYIELIAVSESSLPVKKLILLMITLLLNKLMTNLKDNQK